MMATAGCLAKYLYKPRGVSGREGLDAARGAEPRGAPSREGLDASRGVSCKRVYNPSGEMVIRPWEAYVHKDNVSSSREGH